MDKNSVGFKPAVWVPTQAKESFLNLYVSLSLSCEPLKREKVRINNGEKRDISFSFNKGKTIGSAITLYEQQLKAIKTLLTDNKLQKFWEICSDSKALEFKNVWQEAFNDWFTRPNITEAKKKKEIQKAKNYLDKIISIYDSDPSLQREISIALTRAINNQWHETRHEGDEWEALEILGAGSFLNQFSKSLDEIISPECWESTHARYPRQIGQPSATKQFLISRFSPIIYSIYGGQKHAEVTKFLALVFDCIVTRDTVRKSNAE